MDAVFDLFWSFCRIIFEGPTSGGIIETLFGDISFPAIFQFVGEGPLRDKVKWDYHPNAYDFVHHGYDRVVDETLDRLAGIHEDKDCWVCGDFKRVNRYFDTCFDLEYGRKAMEVLLACEDVHDLWKCEICRHCSTR